MPIKLSKDVKQIENGEYLFLTANGWSTFADICYDFKDKFKVAESTARDRIYYLGWDWEEAIVTPPLSRNDIRGSHQVRKHYRRLQKGITKIKV